MRGGRGIDAAVLSLRQPFLRFRRTLVLPDLLFCVPDLQCSAGLVDPVITDATAIDDVVFRSSEFLRGKAAVVLALIKRQA